MSGRWWVSVCLCVRSICTEITSGPKKRSLARFFLILSTKTPKSRLTAFSVPIFTTKTVVFVVFLCVCLMGCVCCVLCGVFVCLCGVCGVCVCVVVVVVCVCRCLLNKHSDLTLTKRSKSALDTHFHGTYRRVSSLQHEMLFSPRMFTIFVMMIVFRG